MFVVGNLSEMPMGQQIHRRKRRPWDPTYNFVTTHANSLVPCKGSFISTIDNLSPIQTTPYSRFYKNPFGSWLEMGVDDGLLQSSATKPPMNEIFFSTPCSHCKIYCRIFFLWTKLCSQCKKILRNIYFVTKLCKLQNHCKIFSFWMKPFFHCTYTGWFFYWSA